jgi:radical SAM family uncharacterized protein/radical SAM-linked protein
LALEYKHGLWSRLDKEVLPFVTKPGRYVGNELNSIHKGHENGILKIALCFPEMYEIGMSYLGMQILYDLINRRPDCLAERAFAFWPDMEEAMRQKGIPAFSLESSTPLAEFDVIGFHLTYEMTFATALNMLELAGIPLLSKDRRETDPLILAGGSSTLNPEPMADFIDAFFLGDAEEAIHEIIDAIKESKAQGLSRHETLLGLSRISGIYIPQFYEPEYDKSGHFAALKKLNPEAPDRIKIQSVPELKTEYYPRCPVVPFIETTHDHLSIEIMRGCVRGCRFCQAGYQYRPRRQRPVDDIVDHLFNGLACTGYDDVTLLSLSSTDYKDINELLARVNPRLSEQRIGLGLPSLRPETLTPSILEAISSGRKTGLTLAPEAGTERLRAVLGKNISDSAIYGAIETALDSGWQTFKLYFMIGLPTETVDDIDGIVAMLRKIAHLARQRPGRSSINVSLSPFNPKTHTPWQWEKQVGSADLKRKIDRIIDGVRKPNINIKYRDLDLSIIEGIIGRGDRRLGTVILKACRKGSHLDGWSELFDKNRWYEAFTECGVDPNFYSSAIDLDAPLPWDHIDKGISKEFLKKDNLKSKEGILPATAFDRIKAIEPKAPAADGFGRRQKRFIKQTTAPGTFKLRVRYSRDERLRYLSHLDIIRTLYRALRRGEIPVAYSEGFHPHIKISFGQPLPLGYTSDAEYFDLQISQPFREEFMARLKTALPPGLEITGYKYYFANVSSLTRQLNMARYEIPPIEGIEYDSACIAQIVSSKSLPVTRVREGVEKQVDAGQFIENIKFQDKGLVLDVSQTPDGHIKPEELLTFGLELDERLVKPLVIHRRNQFQKTGQRLIDPLDLV